MWYEHGAGEPIRSGGRIYKSCEIWGLEWEEGGWRCKYCDVPTSIF